MCAASGGLYDVPACGAGTAGSTIAVRGWGTSGAYVKGISYQSTHHDETPAFFFRGRTFALTPRSDAASACADHTSYCPLFLTASETSSSALPAPGCEGSTMLFNGPLRSFRAILRSRSFSRELTRDRRGRA